MSPSVSIIYGCVPVLVIVEDLRGSSVDLNLYPSLTIVLLRVVACSTSSFFDSVPSSHYIVFQ